MTASEQSSAPLPVAEARSSPAHRDLALVTLLLAVFALSRGLVFPFAENLYGDAVVRSELAERWAREPHLITSFQDGAYQFGPLHLYLMGGLLELWPSREHATRLVSLLASLLMVLPVYRLGRRLFSREAALATGLAMAAWGLHIQASTTAASEAVFLTLFFFALDYLFKGLDEGRLAPLAVAALFTNLFCAVRYDGWLYGPLLGLAVAFSGKDRIAGITRAAVFLGLSAPYPLWWMQQSEKASGDALFALHYIEQFHGQWVNDGIAWLGEAGFRLMALFFWPGSLLATASLLVGIFAIAGMVRAFVRKERRALAILAIVPAAYFTFRGAALANFSPLARFTMAQVALSLFYVKDGFDWIAGRLPAWPRRSLAVAAGLVALGTTLWLGSFTAWRSGVWEDTLRPISPLSTIPNDQRAAASYLKQAAAPDHAVVIDEASDYVDINVAFFTGLPDERLVRRRWENFEKHLGEVGAPRLLFATSGGALEAKDGVKVGEPQLSWRGWQWRKVAQPSDKLFVYQRL
ncbi:MAG: ArnT family glycosyltransferase [Myxococcales bacterium]|jgi:4-amino-4-deoxy-L-arabinose transferase-like glycosyltransferase